MEPEKPFRTIEVIDSRTDLQCKVACMSCIRGHRTTSCGIPVCRTKIFWTVKRPGRPANTCTCRFGAGGRCRCVVATSACPHKSKRGGKKTVECRCEEQGRSCCVLQPQHWNALIALLTPRVDFYPDREALEEAITTLGASQTTAYPPTQAYTVSTPGSTPRATQSVDFMQTPPPSQHSTPAPIPRFDLMGVGASHGPSYDVPDVLEWEGQTRQAPRDYHPFVPQDYHQARNTAANPTTTQPVSSLSSEHAYRLPPNRPYANLDFTPVTQSFEEMSMLPQEDPEPPSALDLDKVMADYLNHQFPSAICQNCGMSGCTCKNCPAVMQNSINGSWAQCCARKHTHLGPPTPYSAINKVLDADPQQARGGCCSGEASSRQAQQIDSPNVDDALIESDLQYGMMDLQENGRGCCSGSSRRQQDTQPLTPPMNETTFNHDPGPMQTYRDVPPEFSPPFDLGDFSMPDSADPIGLSDILMDDLGMHANPRGCICCDELG